MAKINVVCAFCAIEEERFDELKQAAIELAEKFGGVFELEEVNESPN